MRQNRKAIEKKSPNDTNEIDMERILNWWFMEARKKSPHAPLHRRGKKCTFLLNRIFCTFLCFYVLCLALIKTRILRLGGGWNVYVLPNLWLNIKSSFPFKREKKSLWCTAKKKQKKHCIVKLQNFWFKLNIVNL